MTFWMPPEWSPHERTWMAWPSAGYTLGDSPLEVELARSTWAAVANEIVRFELVSMLCQQADLAVARTYLDSRVELIEAQLDDAWMRDIGPTFVVDSSGKLGGVKWVFNGWGAQPWASWEHDAKISGFIADLAEAQPLESWLINEGGGIHVNGAGAVLLTETVQLGEGRNAGESKERVEAEIHRLLGTETAIWLKRGLTRDYDEFGTRGHVDIVACFADENTILYHDQRDPSHPDFEISAEVKRTLDAAGNFKLVPVPAPATLTDDEGWVDYSYINHYVVNGAVILCSFDDPNDEVAREILAAAYPNREIVLVPATALFARGGGIHCITQQQPRVF